MPEAAIREAIGNGLEHHRAGRLSQAEAMYQRALQMAPEHPQALHLLGAIAHQTGRNGLALELMGKAIASHRRALSLDPMSPYAHFNLALALAARGDRDEAMDCYRKTLSLKPDFSEAHNNLGLELAGEGRLDEALACYRAAIAARPDNAEAHNNLGNALTALGQAQAALASYRRAVEIADLPVSRANFAQCLRNVSLVPKDAAFRRLVARAISEPWARPADLAKVGISLLKADPSLAPCLERASRVWPARPAGRD
ncbi:MAG TPA: tetratricopeptide repeat protein, partial [Usitatibacter sp.]